MASSKLRAISLFSGAGGLDLGLKAAGFAITLHVDSDFDSCETLKKNSFSEVNNEQIDPVSLEQLVGEGTIDLLAGGPPCQPFSKSSQWSVKANLGLKDARANTVEDFIDVVKRLKPRAFLFENVPQFVKLGGLERLTEELSRSNYGSYELTHSLLNAADYGAPQNRVRLFVVGLRSGESFSWPKKYYDSNGLPNKSIWDYVVSARTDNPAELKGKWTDLLPSIPPGKNYLYHTPRGDGLKLFGWRTRYWSFLFKADPGGLSPTIVANPSQNNGPFHWENRNFTLSELARIQTFPRDYEFVGSAESVRRQIGNAVPPLVGEVLGRQLIRTLGMEPERPRLKFVARRAKAEPTIPTLRKVPDAFMRFIDDHPDHPGPGLGPSPRIQAASGIA